MLLIELIRNDLGIEVGRRAGKEAAGANERKPTHGEQSEKIAYSK